MDFGSFIASGIAAGEGENPYSSDLPLVYVVRSNNSEKTILSPNLNPPISLLVFRTISNMDPLYVVNFWRVISALLFGSTVFILSKMYREQFSILRLLWSFSLAGFWNTLALGQIYVPLLFLVTCVWVFSKEEYSRLVGIALGIIVAVKPNFSFWLLLLLVSGYRTLFSSAVATAILLSFLPIPIYGLQIYRQWFTAISEYPSLGLLIAGNSSFQSLGTRFGTLALGWIAILLLIIICLNIARKQKEQIHTIHALGIVASLLIFPFSWVGYTILTLPIFISRSQWSWKFTLSASLLVFPYLLVLYYFQGSTFNSVVFGWLYGWALLILVLEIIIHPQKIEGYAQAKS